LTTNLPSYRQVCYGSVVDVSVAVQHRQRVPEADLRQQRLLQFGEHLRELRTDAGLTQEDLAHLANLHRAELGFYERGEREPGITALWDLANALKVDLPLMLTFTSRPVSRRS
jgi:DNA-binding XRE family transcriptional regulator